MKIEPPMLANSDDDRPPTPQGTPPPIQKVPSPEAAGHELVMFGRRETREIPVGTRRIEAYRAGMDNSPGRRLRSRLG
jgi:hypothetical protein